MPLKQALTVPVIEMKLQGPGCPLPGEEGQASDLLGEGRELTPNPQATPFVQIRALFVER